MVTVLLLASRPGLADQNEPGTQPNGLPDQPLVNFTLGQEGVDGRLENPWRFGIEYRFAPVTDYRLVPSIGLAWANNEANFLYIEARRDFKLAGSWLLTPSFGFGRFNNRPDFNLGESLEFRSGVELACRFQGGTRLGMAIFHLSNGGLSDRNPGTEAVVASLSTPWPRH